MEILSRQRLLRNAYRVLGLPADASQKAIDAAARRMRIWPDPQRIPPTPWDLPWLGPIPRTRNDIERAVADLTDPVTRIDQRILWFTPSSADLLRTCTLPDLERIAPQLAASDTAGAQHDATLARIFAAVLLDPLGENEPCWTAALTGVRDLAASEPYRAWLQEMDAAGTFQMPLRPDEITAALGGWERALLGVLVTQVQDSLTAGKAEQGARLHRLMDRLAPSRADAEKRPTQETPVLDRMEDLLEQRCREMITDLHAHVVIDPPRFGFNQHSNARACESAERFYYEVIQPLLNELETLCQGDPERLQRIRYPVARAAAACGTGWVWSGRFVKADLAFRTALQLALGSPLEARIRADLAENRPRAMQESMSYNVLTGTIPEGAEIFNVTQDEIRPVLINQGPTEPQPIRTAPAPVRPPAVTPAPPRLPQPSAPAGHVAIAPRRRDASARRARIFCFLIIVLLAALVRIIVVSADSSTASPPSPTWLDRQVRDRGIQEPERNYAIPSPDAIPPLAQTLGASSRSALPSRSTTPLRAPGDAPPKDFSATNGLSLDPVQPLPQQPADREQQTQK